MHKKKRVGGEIMRAHYKPPTSCRLSLEIFPVSMLRQRVSVDYLRTIKRIEFHLLIFITEGHCMHMVDFESIACGQGSLMILQPGQVHCFDATTDWQGWLVIFRPEFLPPSYIKGETTTLVTELEVFRHLNELPVHLAMTESEQEAVVESIARMFSDTQLKASTGALHILLQNQLYALLNRLHLIVAYCEQTERVVPVLLQRFKRYRFAVEQDFHRWHRVTDYAKRLGCSEKSLGRAALEVTGASAKAFLSQRIALEGKRLLAHTGLPISLIADKLGFDEATNFIKFFRREVGCTPGDFRRCLRADEMTAIDQRKLSQSIAPQAENEQGDSLTS